MSAGARAAWAFWLGMIAWDCTCADGQTLSEALARGVQDRHTRVAVSTVLILSVAHIFGLAAQNHERGW